MLLDVRLEDGNGIQALAERGARARPAVLVISSFETSQYVAAAARYGAAGFLLKTVPLPTPRRRDPDGAAPAARCSPQEQLTKGFVTLTPRERADRPARDGRASATRRSRRSIGAVAEDRREPPRPTIYERFGITGGRVELSLRAAEEGWLDIEPPATVRAGELARR